MQVKTEALVLSTVKYQDKNLIVRCLTQALGVRTFFVRNALGRRKNASKIGYFQPLALLEIEVNTKEKGGLDYFKEVRLAHAYQTVTHDYIKGTIAIFVAEVLHHTLHGEEPDVPLFTFLKTSLLWLDHQEYPANFHLILLMELTKYLGFYPDMTHSDKVHFNAIAGGFTDFYEPGCYTAEETILFKKIAMHSFGSDQQVFTGSQRRVVLDLLLRYYECHISGFRKPNSVEVLKELFRA